MHRHTKSMLGDAPEKDFKAYTLTRPFSLHVLRQTVSRNMGYEVCQEVPLQYVNKGVLKLQRAVKKRGVEPPIFFVHSLGRLTFDLSVTEEDPLDSIC